MSVLSSNIFQFWLITYLYRYVNLVWEKNIARNIIKDGLYPSLINPNQFKENQPLIDKYIGYQFVFKHAQYYLIVGLFVWAFFTLDDLLVLFLMGTFTFYNNYTAFK